MISKGYIALTEQPVDRDYVRACVAVWLERFEKVEQVAPLQGSAISTLSVASPEDVMWEENPQFRVLNGPDFTWVYMTLGKQVIETSGLPADEISLCLNVLLELPDIAEVVDQINERRLEQLESEGLL